MRIPGVPNPTNYRQNPVLDREDPVRIPGVPNPTDYRDNPVRIPGVPNPTDYRENPVRICGVPNPTDYRENPWIAQPPQTRLDDLVWLSEHKNLRKSRIARFKISFCMVLKVPKSHVNLRI